MENEAIDMDLGYEFDSDFSAIDELDLDFLSESDEQLLQEFAPVVNTYSEGYY